jgi:hypothetical protein
MSWLLLSYFLATKEEEATAAVNAVERDWTASENFMMESSDARWLFFQLNYDVVLWYGSQSKDSDSERKQQKIGDAICSRRRGVPINNPK